MSTQKHHVSVRMPNSFAEYPVRQNECCYGRLSEPVIKEDKYACRHLEKHRHYKIVLRNESTSSTDVRSSYRHRKRNRQRKKVHVSESAMLQQKIRELDILRKRLELIERAITTQYTDTEDLSEINLRKSQSCFSLLNLLASKKHVNKAEIVRLVTTPEINKHSPSNPNKNEQASNSKIVRNSKKDNIKEIENKENCYSISKEYQFTNDNIASPESCTQLPRTTKDQLLYLNEKLELQNIEIQYIKEKLEECINMLKYNSSVNIFNGIKSMNLDDYININKVDPKLSSNYIYNIMSKEMEKYDLKRKNLLQPKTSAEKPKSVLKNKTAIYTNTSTSILRSSPNLDGSDIVYKNTKSSVIVKVGPAHGKNVPVRNGKNVRKEKLSHKTKHKTKLSFSKQKKKEAEDLNKNRSYVLRFVRFILCKCI